MNVPETHLPETALESGTGMSKLKFILPIVGFALLVALFAFGIKNSQNNGILASVLIGKPAPDFSLPSLTDPGTTVGPKDFKGKPYLLNVFGTWCPSCRVEHPFLMQLQQQGQIGILGLNWKDNNDDTLAWLAQLGNPYSRIAVDPQGRAVIDWGVYGAPETFLVDARGIIVYKHVGAMDQEVWEREFLPRLTGKPAGPT
jgi:cytochrome c biogenesis protein CcmG, thiol:disulfide interchange protein DsbE